MTLRMETAVSRPFPAGGGRTTVEVMLDPIEKSRPSTRHAALLVDTSTSMELPTTKIERARTGVARVLDELDDDDRVSVISFDSDADVLVPMTRWGDADRADARRAVTGSGDGEYDGELVASGGTDIRRALETARDQLAGAEGNGHVSRDIILLSDGQDSRDTATYEDLAAEIREDGISIVAGGIGSGYNEEVMLALARESGGEPYDLQEPDAIDTFLEARVREAGDLVAPGPQLRIDVADGFMIDSGEPAYFTEPQIQSATVRPTDEGATVDLPKLIVGKRHRFTFEVLGQPQPTGLSYHLADLIVTDGERLASASVEATYEDDGDSKARIEKERASAKLTTDINDADVDDTKIRADIDDLERERGWSKTAAELRDRLSEADEDGGAVRISKARLDHDG